MSGRRRGFTEPQPPMRGLCAGADPDAWFPLSYNTTEAMEAKAICGVCNIQSECLEDALVNRIEFGIYGGTDPDERRAMLRRHSETQVAGSAVEMEAAAG